MEAEQFRRAGSVFVSEDVMVAWTRVTAEERGWTRQGYRLDDRYMRMACVLAKPHKLLFCGGDTIYHAVVIPLP